jgi:hypothetical protein
MIFIFIFFFPSRRRMFPSMRISLSGLDNDQNYCVLLEMVPIADCRFKFSGSQWVPAGGAEPQSLQNIYIHPDSPALGSHWQAQPINFNKVKLTNNTLDSSGHVSIITRLSPCKSPSLCLVHIHQNSFQVLSYLFSCERRQ